MHNLISNRKKKKTKKLAFDSLNKEKLVIEIKDRIIYEIKQKDPQQIDDPVVKEKLGMNEVIYH